MIEKCHLIIQNDPKSLFDVKEKHIEIHDTTVWISSRHSIHR